jgi:hypothetical protein
MSLFNETEHGLEPLWLWLTEAGTPMAYASWEKVFDAANARQVYGDPWVLVRDLLEH